MDSFTKINSYIAEYYDPRTGTKGRFQIKAFKHSMREVLTYRLAMDSLVC